MDPGSGQPPLRHDNCRPDLLGPCPIGQVSVTAADGPDCADANAACVAVSSYTRIDSPDSA
jgi:hypothetical protein